MSWKPFCWQPGALGPGGLEPAGHGHESPGETSRPLLSVSVPITHSSAGGKNHRMGLGTHRTRYEMDLD